MEEREPTEKSRDYYNCCKCGEYTPEGKALVFSARQDNSRISEDVFRLCERCLIELQNWIWPDADD